MEFDAEGNNWQNLTFEGKRVSTDDIAETAEARGYDGIKIKDLADDNSDEGGSPSDHYAVFRPTQIKSAIGNRGTFDPKDPDIRNANPHPTGWPNERKDSNLDKMGDCRDENLVEDIFGSVSEFDRIDEQHSGKSQYKYGNVLVKYDPKTDIHTFYKISPKTDRKIINSFENHAGRPGEVGGSSPRYATVDLKRVKSHDSSPPYIGLVRQAVKGSGDGKVFVTSDDGNKASIRAHETDYLGDIEVPSEALKYEPVSPVGSRFHLIEPVNKAAADLTPQERKDTDVSGEEQHVVRVGNRAEIHEKQADGTTKVVESKMFGPDDYDKAKKWAIGRAPQRIDRLTNSATTKLGFEQPTPAQLEAGNYSKHKVKFAGLNISIETPSGSARKGVGADGKPWENVNNAADYGYVTRNGGKKSVDGDELDVYLSKNPSATAPVFIVDQVNSTTKIPDEMKVILGSQDEAHAKQIYMDGFSDGKGSDRIGKITTLTIKEFKAWLKKGDIKSPIFKKV